MEGIGFRLGGVTVRRGGREVLRGIDWEVRPGETWGVVGPNGAGKSTLLLTLAGVLRSDSGRLEAWRGDGRALQRGDIGLLLQRHPEPPPAPLSALELAALGGVGRLKRAEARSRAGQALESLGVADLAHRRFDRLSGGQRSGVHLARLLVQRPGALLLDEPAASLDPPARAELRALLAEIVSRRPVTVVAVAHDLAHLPAATTHVAALREGRMVASGPWDEVVRPEVLERVFGVPVTLAGISGAGVVMGVRRDGGGA